MSLPLFTDEAIYVRWAQIARIDASWRFISLTDGKQPSFIWIAMVLLRFINDPLLATRLVSVGAGFLTMIGLFFLGAELFKNKLIGAFSSIMYLIFPMAFVYDRMALYDSLVGTFAVWGIYLQTLLVRRVRLDIALILALVIGGGFLTKTSNFFSAYLLPFSLVLFDWKKKDRYPRLFKFISFACIAVILAFIYYSVLRLSPFFNNIAEKNVNFVYSVHDFLQHPTRFLIGNFLGQWDWTLKYFTWPVIILIAASAFTKRAFWREKLILFIWFFAPFFLLALWGKVLYPRFIFFMLLMLLPLAAVSLEYLFNRIKNKVVFTFVCLGIFGLVLRSDYLIVTDFARSTIPSSDSEQYMNGWPAGGGLKEIIAYLDEQSKKGKLYVASEGGFGSVPTYAIEIYLDQNKNIDKRGIWPPPKELPDDLLEKAQTMPVYYIFNQTQQPPTGVGWPLELVFKHRKGISDSYIFLYKVKVTNEKT